LDYAQTLETGHHGDSRYGAIARGAETLQRETAQCVNEPRHAVENHYCADAARQQTKERRPGLSTPVIDHGTSPARYMGDHRRKLPAKTAMVPLHGGSELARGHSNLPFHGFPRHPGADTLAMYPKRETAHD